MINEVLQPHSQEVWMCFLYKTCSKGFHTQIIQGSSVSLCLKCQKKITPSFGFVHTSENDPSHYLYPGLYPFPVLEFQDIFQCFLT